MKIRARAFHHESFLLGGAGFFFCARGGNVWQPDMCFVFEQKKRYKLGW